MADERLYRIGPGSGEWISREQLMASLTWWLEIPQGEGVPAITISKRAEDQDQ